MPGSATTFGGPLSLGGALSLGGGGGASVRQIEADRLGGREPPSGSELRCGPIPTTPNSGSPARRSPATLSWSSETE